MSAAPSLPPDYSFEPTPDAPAVEPAAMAEADHPRNGVILMAAGAIILVVLLFVIGVVQLFGQRVRAEISQKQLEHESTELRALRADEQAKLSRYQWVSEKDGVVRLPLARARELVLDDYRLAQSKKAATP